VDLALQPHHEPDQLAYLFRQSHLGVLVSDFCNGTWESRFFVGLPHVFSHPKIDEICMKLDIILLRLEEDIQQKMNFRDLGTTYLEKSQRHFEIP
jgi:hypothetical protein